MTPQERLKMIKREKYLKDLKFFLKDEAIHKLRTFELKQKIDELEKKEKFKQKFVKVIESERINSEIKK